jgi:hypothetical protein
MGKQKVVDFLITKRADSFKKDATGRTAQEIADFLKTGIKVPMNSPEILKFSQSDFSSFVENPTKYSLQLSGNMDQIEKFGKIYESYCQGTQNEQLDQFLLKQIEDKKFDDLFKNSFLRMNSKEDFFSTILSAKKLNSWPKKVRNLFYVHFHTLEDEGELNEDEMILHVLDQLFNDWVNEKSEVMEELNSMIDFKKTVNKDMKLNMLKKVRELKKPEILFPEMEDFFLDLKLFKSLTCNSEFKMFIQMNSEIKKLKSEMKKKDDEIQELKTFIQKKAIIMNPDIPHDAVFISDE